MSAKAGLRAKEIAHLTWRMAFDAAGQVGHAIHLTNDASKGMSGRVIPMHPEVRAALIAYRQTLAKVTGEYVIGTERMSSTSPQVIVNMFQRWYRHLGFVGCSSHSGRRTFITGAARKISFVGGSLRDVQALAGHSNLRTTQRYIEENADAQRRVVQQL
nr:site-specific integrase [Bradyrhizobium sp. CCGE-LA001]